MSGISTHVLDLASGRPAAGIAVKLLRWANGTWFEVAEQNTDADGRCRELLSFDHMTASVYRIIFDIASYYEPEATDPATARPITDLPLYPDVSITFHVQHPGSSYHMPLLLSPNGYTTYRGS
jgi:5-hydroxyisourate hydrolase